MTWTRIADTDGCLTRMRIIGKTEMEGIRGRLLQDLPYLRRFALALVCDRDRADALVEEALVHALSLIEQWKPGTNLRTWLFGILYRVYASDIPRYAASGSGPTGPRTAPESRTPRNELERALFDLPHEQQIVLFLSSLEGMTYGEVAAVTGAPVATVRAHMAAARAALRESMDETGRTPTGPSI
jgi:RNA polymerase sigma-70 factor (ECF subfamily)